MKKSLPGRAWAAYFGWLVLILLGCQLAACKPLAADATPAPALDSAPSQTPSAFVVSPSDTPRPLPTSPPTPTLPPTPTAAVSPTLSPTPSPSLSPTATSWLISGERRVISPAGYAGLGANLSGNGQAACFWTDFGGGWNTFWTDLLTGESVNLNVNLDGTTASGWSWFCDLSFDGQWVVFNTLAPILPEVDRNGSWDIYVQNMRTGEVLLVSHNRSGEASNGDSKNPAISADGKWVVFDSLATDLAEDPNPRGADIFLWRRETGVIQHLTPAGINDSSLPDISGDGSRIVFQSESPLVDGQQDEVIDIFLFNQETGSTQRITQGASADCEAPKISEDGQVIVFQSKDWTLIPGSNRHLKVFLWDLQTQAFSLVSPNADGQDPYGDSMVGGISGDGQKIAFIGRMVKSAGVGYVYDRAAGTILPIQEGVVDMDISAGGDILVYQHSPRPKYFQLSITTWPGPSD